MQERVRDILDAVIDGRMTREQAGGELLAISNEPLGFATIDHQRLDRCGVPEVIYAAGKTANQVVAIAHRLIERSGYALVTRVDREQADAVAASFDRVQADERRRTLLIGQPIEARGTPIPIVTAGTSDAPVADEAELTCAALGQRVKRINDVGVAGLGRLLQRMGELNDTGVIVCIAGMEGALPSVIGGLVRVPVIAVPTSVGYGAAFDGLAALLGMMTSCAAGVSVVNIDNGFGAAYSAALIQRQFDRTRGEASP
jgi:NCAIR mutase (PurE)-related protein